MSGYDPDHAEFFRKYPDKRTHGITQADADKFQTPLFILWLKAQSLEFDDFKGWCKGEGYEITKTEQS